MGKVFHGSEIGGLEFIVPQASIQGESYVYATGYQLLSTIFIPRWNDFLLSIRTSVQHGELKVRLIERYQNAFQEIFAKQSGYIYILEDQNFVKNKTNWAFEEVSEREEKVLLCTKIDDIWEEIKTYEDKGELELFCFPNRPEDIPADDSDLVEKAADLYRISGNAYNAIYCMIKFPHLKEQVQQRFLNEFGMTF